MLNTMLMSLTITENTTEDLIISDLSAAINKTGAIYTFINPFSYYVAKNDSNYRYVLSQFDGVFADGIGVVTAARCLGLKVPTRLSFDTTSLAPTIFPNALANHYTIYLIGGKEGTAEKAAGVVGAMFPGIRIVGTASGYFPSVEEAGRLLIDIGPDIVICGMGAPKQEEFLLYLKQLGWKGIGFTCGGYLDQLGGGYRYYPAIVDKLNIRFLYRLFKEPKRLWKRYTLDYRVFLLMFADALLKKILSIFL